MKQTITILYSLVWHKQDSKATFTTLETSKYHVCKVSLAMMVDIATDYKQGNDKSDIDIVAVLGQAQTKW